MRLVINSRNCNANEGLNRYNGKGIYQALGPQHTGLRKVEKDETNANDLKKKSIGKGINDSSMGDVDAVDSSNIEESTKVDSDEDSVREAINNSSNGTVVNKDKESIADDEEKSAHDDEESSVDDEEVDINDEKEDVNDADLKEEVDDQKSGDKRKYPPSLVDYLINNNTDDTSITIPTKLQRLDSPMSYCHDENDTSTKSDVDDFDTHLDTLLNDKKDHSLIKIPPTKKKRYPQKICVHCRQNLGVRNDTRYICTLCDVALCKIPCFSEYHRVK